MFDFINMTGAFIVAQLVLAIIGFMVMKSKWYWKMVNNITAKIIGDFDDEY